MTHAPHTIDEVQQIVADARALTICGASTKATPAPDHSVMDLRALAGIKEYTPAECVFSAYAGTPIREIDAALAAHGQYLPFDPPLAEVGATIGGTVAAGLSGPGRYRYGGVRDFLIGAAVVDGEGRLIRSGGKVVKNAAGFLLHHALVGSAGRFGAIVEVAFKVFPAPEAAATLAIRCRGLHEAMAALDALGRERFELASVESDAQGMSWIRLAGRAATLPARIDRAVRVLGAMADRPIAIDALAGNDDRAIWSEASAFAWAPRDASLVKVPTTPSLVSALAPLRRDPTRIRFGCGFNVAWIAWEDELPVLSKALSAAGASGIVVKGPGSGELVGLATHNAFAERVRRVLDPHNKFRAASHPAH